MLHSFFACITFFPCGFIYWGIFKCRLKNQILSIWFLIWQMILQQLTIAKLLSPCLRRIHHDVGRDHNASSSVTFIKFYLKLPLKIYCNILCQLFAFVCGDFIFVILLLSIFDQITNICAMNIFTHKKVFFGLNHVAVERIDF